jgi:1-aminocyclopropane-1-carboxylate deaminase/D-cysteine desulfhydrase-like pyridoxal-dependent ACC family enzyme
MSSTNSLTARLPRATLGNFPTPLEEAPNLAAALGGPKILIKRDDLSGLSVGGSKTRIFEFVLGQAQAEGATAVVAMAGEQSNKLRELAAGANRLGMKPILLLHAVTQPPAMIGNRFLFDVLGAEVHTTPIPDRLDPAIKGLLEDLCADAERRGYQPFMVYHPERTGTIGTASYVSGAEELLEQLGHLAISPSRIFMATGAGPTTAGMVLGCRAHGETFGITGVSVGSPHDAVMRHVLDYANKCADMIGIDRRISANDLTIDATYHATTSPISLPVKEAIELFARTEGVLLDPTYTGKAAAGMIAAIRRGDFSADDTIVFVHTGGLPGLFARSGEFGYEARL